MLYKAVAALNTGRRVTWMLTHFKTLSGRCALARSGPSFTYLCGTFWQDRLWFSIARDSTRRRRARIIRRNWIAHLEGLMTEKLRGGLMTSLIAAGAALVATIAVIYLPHLMLAVDGLALSSPNSAKHVADTRASLVQLLAGFAAAATVYFTWRNYVRTSAEAVEAHRQAAEARIAGDYLKACEQLGGSNQAVRAGVTLAWGRLLRAVSDSSDQSDYWAIMDILTTFVRHRAAIEDAPAKRTRPDRDVEAALNVLARRTAASTPQRREDSPVALSGCDLTGAWLGGAKYAGAYFGGSCLRNADFSDADLCGALFHRADLQSAVFARAQVRGADFSKATSLEGVDFGDVDIQAAIFSAEQLAQLRTISPINNQVAATAISPAATADARHGSSQLTPPADRPPSNPVP